MAGNNAKRPQSSGTDSLNPYNYQLEVLTIVNNEGITMDVRNMMGECRIYESILNNFLMGELAIIDALEPSLFEQMHFTGQESLRIKFSHGEENSGNKSIDKLFRIYKVSDVQRHNQGQLQYMLSFCSPEFLTSRRFRISKAYRGSHAGVAAKIGDEYLNITSPKSGNISRYSTKGLEGHKHEPYWEHIALNSLDEDYQFVIPNWTVNYTMNWLCNEALEDTTNIAPRKHSSFDSLTFWYQSAQGDYKIESLKDMLETEFLHGAKFIYSPVSENETVDFKLEDGDKTKTVKVSGQKIINYQEGQHADFLEGIVYGIFAGEQTTVDLRNKMYYESQWSYFDSPQQGEETTGSYPMIRDTKEVKWVGNAIDLPGEGTDDKIHPVAAEPFKPMRPAKHPTEIPASEFHQAYSILENQTPKIFEDNTKYNSEGLEGIPKAVIIKQAALKLLEYNTITAQISARTDISAGKIIDLSIPATDTGLGAVRGIDREDNFNSGKHLITEVMWSLMPTELKTNITCMRDTCITKIEKYYGDFLVAEMAKNSTVTEDDNTT
tara:strand:- start:1474 stop:3123 length:1650 start_codon:yes stop_codon:yes gene_type:complete